MEFSVSYEAIVELKKLFEGIEEGKALIRLSCSKTKDGGGGTLYELMSIDEEEILPEEVVLSTMQGINFYVSRGLEKFFDNVTLDYKKDKDQSVFFFYKTNL